MTTDFIEHRLYQPVGDTNTLLYRMPTHKELENWGFNNAQVVQTWKVVGFISLLTGVEYEVVQELGHQDFTVAMMIVSRLSEQAEIRNHIHLLRDKLVGDAEAVLGHD